MSITPQRNASPKLSKAFFLSICAVTIGLIQFNEVAKTEVVDISSLEKDTELRQQLSIANQLPSFGFRNLLAGGVFLNFLQYFSDVSKSSDTEEHLSPDFFEAIVKLDPFYRDYYLFLSGSTTLHAAQPEKTVSIMAKGLAQMSETAVAPDSFYIWRYKGVDELLFLGDSEAARKSFENAADWASRSQMSDSEVMEKASRQTSEFLKRNPDSLYAQIAAWNSIVANALNDDIRNKAAQRVQELTSVLKAQADQRERSDTANASPVSTLGTMD